MNDWNLDSWKYRVAKHMPNYENEKDLKNVFEKKDWNKLHLQIIFWGREFCTARSCWGLECKICKSCNPNRKRKFIHKKP